jgi:hypothetical protein
MKRKTEYLVLGILIVVLSVYLAVRGRDRTHYRVPQLEKIAADRIARIDIQGPEGHVEIKKEGDRWLLMPGSYPADVGTVDRLLKDIGGLKLTALVAESKSYQRYDLGDKQKITVEARSGDRQLLRKFEIGKAAPSLRHTFVKIGGDGRVFHAPGDLKELFGRKPEGFRDRTVLAFDRGAVREIRVVKGKQKAVFRRQPGAGETRAGDAAAGKQTAQRRAWQVDGGGTPDSARIERFLGVLDKLKCDGYLRGRQKSEFKQPAFEVLLKDDKGEYRLALFAAGDREKEKIPGVSSQNQFPFYLEEWQARRVMLSPQELMETGKKKSEKAS